MEGEIVRQVEYKLPNGWQPGYVWVTLRYDKFTCTFWNEADLMAAVKRWVNQGFELVT